jgi:radical SAM protein with 4Fe4S-binding SPASM domain
MIDTAEKERSFYDIFRQISDVQKIDIVNTVGAKTTINYKEIFGEYLHKGGLNQICPHPFFMINIKENGDCTPCCGAFTDAPILGNCFEWRLSEIWNKSLELQRKLLNNLNSIAKCARCCVRETMCNNPEDFLDDRAEELARRYE